MKKNNLPRAWAVKNDGSQKFKYEVVGYMNEEAQSPGLWQAKDIGRFYGYDGSGRFSASYISKEDCAHIVELTIDEFIKLKNETYFELPKNWYVVVTEENKEYVKEWYDNKNGLFSAGAAYGICDGIKRNRAEYWHKELNWTEISTEQFMEYVLKKKGAKILGYKFKPGFEKYSEQAAEIGHGYKPYIKGSFLIKTDGVNFHANSDVHDNLKSAGLLDVWFEPVYAIEEETFQIGSSGVAVKVMRDPMLPSLGEISVDGHKIDISEVKRIHNMLRTFDDFPIQLYGGRTRKTEGVLLKIGCSTFTTADVKKIIDSYERVIK